MKQITIFDTTLRDGEQSPGFSMNMQEKLQVAKHLDAMHVDTIEAGFPITSEDDFAAVQAIAQSVQHAEVCALARATSKDIDCAWNAIKDAKKPVIHTFLATSPIHREFKLKKSKDEIIAMAVKAVRYAKSLCPKVIFSPEDGTRTEPEFLWKVLSEVIAAGADVLNIPDTVGYSISDEYQKIIEGIRANVTGIENVVISTHCQNDLGLATANSLAGIQGGATEIQCTINGIGERAGNASLEEVVMAIETRTDWFEAKTRIKTQELHPISKRIQSITGVPVQPNKAIVGANAFAHESGIHQDGMLKNRETYEIMKPEDVGIMATKLVLGKHSGRHAVQNRLQELGYAIDGDALDDFFVRFKNLADKKKEVFDEDLYLLMNKNEEENQTKSGWKFIDLTVTAGTQTQARAHLVLQSYETQNIAESSSIGDGPVDATFSAINHITHSDATLEEYSVNAITAGIDAQATVAVRIRMNNILYTASAQDTDIVVASCKAYLEAVNQGF